MSLPLSREATFAPGSEVPSAVLNAIQDAIISIYGGVRTYHLPACHAQLANLHEQTFAVPRLIEDGSGHYWTSNNADDLVLDWPLSFLREGDRILSFTVFGTEGDGSGETYDARLYRATLSTKGAMTAITNLKTSGFTAAATSLAFTTADAGLSPSGYTIPASQTTHFIRTVLKQTNSNDESAIHGITLTVDHAV